MPTVLSRRAVLGLPWAVLLPLQSARAADPAAAVVSRFYDDLLAVMKEAKRLPFDERYNRLAPAIARTFDLALMTRIAVGPSWTQIAGEQQQRLTAAFSRYTISMYASRFDGYGGERFEVLGTSPNANGTLVNTRLVKTDGDPVTLNYLLQHEPDGSWKIIDVYLSGTVSELATRRSEFLAVLQRAGAEGLVQMLEKRIATLRAG